VKYARTFQNKQKKKISGKQKISAKLVLKKSDFYGYNLQNTLIEYLIKNTS